MTAWAAARCTDHIPVVNAPRLLSEEQGGNDYGTHWALAQREAQVFFPPPTPFFFFVLLFLRNAFSQVEQLVRSVTIAGHELCSSQWCMTEKKPRGLIRWFAAIAVIVFMESRSCLRVCTHIEIFFFSPVGSFSIGCAACMYKLTRGCFAALSHN